MTLVRYRRYMGYVLPVLISAFARSNAYNPEIMHTLNFGIVYIMSDNTHDSAFIKMRPKELQQRAHQNWNRCDDYACTQCVRILYDHHYDYYYTLIFIVNDLSGVSIYFKRAEKKSNKYIDFYHGNKNPNIRIGAMHALSGSSRKKGEAISLWPRSTHFPLVIIIFI